MGADRLSFLRRCTVEIGIFSAVLNVLLLVIPLYLLQIYDRVIPSSSYDTLLYLSLAALASLGVLGLLEIVRAQYANRMAARIDAECGSAAFLASMKGPRAAFGDVQPLRDLTTVHSFVASRALFFLFDAPFAPLFILVLYLVHPILFYITAGGAVVLVVLAFVNQLATARTSGKSADSMIGAMNSAQSFARNFETLRALGMLSNVTEAWGRRFSEALATSDRVARANAFLGGLSRTFRLTLQIAILGLGAYLVLQGKMTAGMIFAASILSGRALQPLDQIIGSWRQIVDARRAWNRVKQVVDAEREATSSVALPSPAGALRLEQLVYYLPDAEPSAPPLIKRVSADISPGEAVAIVGPSRAGKSTLARLIVGAIKPQSGAVRLDAADIGNWDPDVLGRYVGYLSQEVELFPGTIAQNIARFEPNFDDEAVIAAAKRAHVHDLVLAQRAGYATEIGPGGVRLSGGERQRIGLARAFYGDPVLLILDEPNANLDADGEAALEQALLEARARERTVLVITHKISIAARCDRVLLLRAGQVETIGPAREVIQKLTRPAQVGPDRSGEPPRGRPEPATAEHTASASFGTAMKAKAN